MRHRPAMMCREANKADAKSAKFDFSLLSLPLQNGKRSGSDFPQSSTFRVPPSTVTQSLCPETARQPQPTQPSATNRPRCSTTTLDTSAHGIAVLRLDVNPDNKMRPRLPSFFGGSGLARGLRHTCRLRCPTLRFHMRRLSVSVSESPRPRTLRGVATGPQASPTLI